MGRAMLIVGLLLLATVAKATDSSSEAAVIRALDSWNEGWATKNAALAVKDYTDDIDWTNAFGDRFQGKEALKEGLEFIFSLDFVMAGNSAKNEFIDVTFLTPEIALMRSKLVRKGQQERSGKVMADRHINHLRVLVYRDGRWLTKSHLISQAQPKR